MTRLVFTILIESECLTYSRTFVFFSKRVAEQFRDRVIEPLRDDGYSVYHIVQHDEPYATAESAWRDLEPYQEILAELQEAA